MMISMNHHGTIVFANQLTIEEALGERHVFHDGHAYFITVWNLKIWSFSNLNKSWVLFFFLFPPFLQQNQSCPSGFHFPPPHVSLRTSN